MLRITPHLSLDESEIHIDFIRASGPGGQNVNKVATGVQLRFDIGASPSLPAEVKERLRRIAGGQVTQEGVLVIEAKRYRTQGRNRQDALNRLEALIQQALRPPKKRHATRPTAASKQRRLETKRRRGDLKRTRRGEDWNP